MSLMLLQIPALFTPDEVAAMRGAIDAAEWVDGNETSGVQSKLAKFNRQLPKASPEGLRQGELIRQRLAQNKLFVSAALPHTVYPPLFNRYGPGQVFKDHIDNALRFHEPTGVRIRADLSATLFLADPETYDGGELTIEDTFGVHEVKLGAGDMILYPSSSLHRVAPVTRGERVASFFWIQSLVRDDGRRALLFDMDVAIQQAAQKLGHDDPSVISLTGGYHNLLRMWSEL